MTRVRIVHKRGGEQEVRVRLHKGEVVDVTVAAWLREHAGRLLVSPPSLPLCTDRVLRYDVSGLMSVYHIMHARRLPDDEELVRMLIDLASVLQLRPFPGCRRPTLLFDARFVFVDDACHLHVVCLPLERCMAPRNDSVLSLLRFMCERALVHRGNPCNKTVYERLLAHVNEQGDVFSLNRFRSFVASLEEGAGAHVDSSSAEGRLVLRNMGTGGVVSLHGGHTYVLGRDERCEVRFADEPKVSRRHACLCCERDGVTLTDTDSLNGTYVEGTRLLPHRPAHVGYGQLFVLSNLELCVERGYGWVRKYVRARRPPQRRHPCSRVGWTPIAPVASRRLRFRTPLPEVAITTVDLPARCANRCRHLHPS